jgi:heptosyltransferase-2
MKLALFLPNWVGDAVMATPALQAIRREYTQAEIVAVMRPVIGDVLTGLHLFDRELHVDPRSPSPELTGRRLVKRLRGERCDTVVLFPNSIRSAWWAWRAGIRRRIGFARDLRGWLLTDPLVPKPKSRPHPVLDEYLRLAERLGCRNLSLPMALAVLPKDRETLDAFWSSYPSQWRQGVVCLNTGGAFGPAKNWPKEYFAELARRITDQLDRTVLVVCGPAERDDARWIAAQAKRATVLSLADAPLSVGLTKAAIAEADILVTTDSGPRHFAAALGIPSVVLFGPTHPAWSDTRDPRTISLQLPVDCGPCQQPKCPYAHHRCMRELTVDVVFHAVHRALREFPASGSRSAA